VDKWQSEPKHKPMQKAAHSRWFASAYIRKWRLPENNEALVGPLLCELAIGRQDPLEQAVIDRILDETVDPSPNLHGALKFETLTGEFEKQPYQFVGPIQKFPALAPVRYLLITHWATNDALQGWLKADVVKRLSIYGETSRRFRSRKSMTPASEST
jgi:hypothetical protein